MPDEERPETLGMSWPKRASPPSPPRIAGYELRYDLDRAAFERVQVGIGWVVTDADWHEVSQSAMVSFVWCQSIPVAVAAGLRRAAGEVELAWVAVVPDHRGKGLGAMVCAGLLCRLLAAEERTLFGSTQDERLAALRIYIELGFHPVYRAEKVERWRRVYSQLNRPFQPDEWGWPTSIRPHPAAARRKTGPPGTR